ncbi:MAG: metallophosphoesterase family protein [Alphaproteobacteria bacterium]|nr:metallophosphoesterase family protein [Alphaproteobacteria bacterium]
MLIALMADIHANREAFAACLAHAREHGAERHVFLGDYVGYGADPAWVVETVMQHVASGSTAILGNHDHAIGEPRETMNPNAQIAIQWTRGQLSPSARSFLDHLPVHAEEGDRLYVHADGRIPQQWRYVTDRDDAARCFEGHAAQWIFCGHVHVPALFGITATHKLLHFQPVAGVPVPLSPQRRWLAVLGSVGQPRDGNAASSYALLDLAKNELTYMRVAYDIERAAAKIRDAGLPEALAHRLSLGR